MLDTGLEKARGGIQVIERAARILRTLRTTRSGMSLGQIAEAVDHGDGDLRAFAAAALERRLGQLDGDFRFHHREGHQGFGLVLCLGCRGSAEESQGKGQVSDAFHAFSPSVWRGNGLAA